MFTGHCGPHVQRVRSEAVLPRVPAPRGASSPASSLLHQWVRAAVCTPLFWIFNYVNKQSTGNSVALINILLECNFRNYILIFLPSWKAKLFCFTGITRHAKCVSRNTVFIVYSLCFRSSKTVLETRIQNIYIFFFILNPVKSISLYQVIIFILFSIWYKPNGPTYIIMPSCRVY